MDRPDDHAEFVQLWAYLCALMFGLSVARSASRALDLGFGGQLLLSVGAVAVTVAVVVPMTFLVLRTRPPRAAAPKGPGPGRSRGRVTMEYLGLVDRAGHERPRIRWSARRVLIVAACTILTGVLAGTAGAGVRYALGA